MRISIIGLPYSGKTTFFDILTQKGMEGSASGKRGSNIATTFVPDERLDKLCEVYEPKKRANVPIEFLDTPGLSTEGDGHGLSGQALEEAKKADTFCLVIQAFDAGVPHPLGEVNPKRDLDFILNEFIMSDYMVMEKRAEKLRKSVQLTKRNEEIRELELVDRILQELENEHPLRELELSEADLKVLSPYQLLTLKPILVVLNIGEDDTADMDDIIAKHAEEYGNLTFTGMCASLESELAQMDTEEAAEFMEDLGIEEPAFDRVIKAAFSLLGLQVYFTVGHDECKAWAMPRNGTAYDAAGAIHSDFQRGFIRAIVLSYEKWLENPHPDTFKRESEQKRKEDPVYDGDLIEFRFNVSK